MVMPRYQRRGIGVAAMPSVSTVGLQEAARTSQTLASALDRVSGFALKRAAEQAKIEGAEFGALNTPTLEEIKQKGEAAIPGDKTTIYGRAAREQALSGVLTHFEMEANTQITDLRIKLAKEEISAEEFREGLQNLNVGLTSALSSIDPASANELRKAIQTTGNSAYLTALSKEQQLRRKDMEVVAEVRMRQLIDGVEGEVSGIIEDIVAAGDTVGPDNKTVSIDDKIEEIILPQLQRMALELSDPEFYSKYADKVRQKVSEAKVNVVVETITQDTLNMFEDDEVNQSMAFEDDVRVKRIYDSLSVDERKQVREQIDAFVDEKQREEDDAASREERQRDKNILQTEIALNAAIKSGNEGQITALFSQLEALSPSAAKSFRDVAQARNGALIDDARTRNSLLIDKANGRLSVAKLNAALSGRKITRSTYDSMFDQFIQQQDRRYQEGLSVLKNAIGYPEYDSVAMGEVQRTALIKLAKIENEYITAREAAINEGLTPPDAFKFFNDKAADASRYPPQQAQEDIDVIMQQYSYDQFDSWGQIKRDVASKADEIPLERYGRLIEALDNLIENDFVYGPFEPEES